MVRYPDTSVGEEADADMLTAMIQDNYIKTSPTAHTSDTTLSDDPELSNIALPVGEYEIDVVYYCNGSAGNVQSAWAFTGTLSGTPRRMVKGPGSSNTGTASNITHQYRSVVNYNTAVTYELSTGEYGIEESCTTFEVTAAGNFSVQFAQGTSNASATNITAGSRVKIRQIG